jgi:peroxiredoxin
VNRTLNSGAVSTTLGADRPLGQTINGRPHRYGPRLLLHVAAGLVLLPLLVIALYILLANTLWGGVGQGQPAPEFSGQDLQGNVVQLSEFRGRPVMLTFWSPDCFACREELPTLQAIATDPSSDVVLLTVVSHMPVSEVQKFMHDQRLTFQVLVDEGARIPALYKVSGIPFTYFIRPDGTVDRAVIGAGEQGALRTDLQGWLKTCSIDAPCKVQE